MKKSLWYKDWLIGLTAGCLFGLVFGLQQSTSIILSSLHDLPKFPLDSLWAVIFNLFLSMVVFGLLTSLLTTAIGLMIRGKKNKELILIPASFGLAFGLVLLVFILGRFAGVIDKKAVVLVILLASGTLGTITGFLFFTLVSWWQKRKKVWLRFWRALVVVALVSLGISLLIVIGLAIQRQVYGTPGFPKQFLIKEEATSEKPNILFLTIDAFRADHASAYDYPQEITPYLDQLAEQGVVFEQAYVNAPWTFPSFVSMLTSRYPTELDTSINELAIEEIENHGRLIEQPETLAERLETLGYNTQAILTNEWLSSLRGFTQGFGGFVNVEKMMPYQYNFHFKDSALVYLLNEIPGVGTKLKQFHNFLFGPGWRHLRTPAFELAPWINSWLENHQQSRFFLWVHLIDPHVPYDPAPQYTPALTDLSPQRVEQLRGIMAHDPGRLRWREIDREALVGLYDGDISQADAALGEIWQKLDELGLMDKTLLIISADHGEEFWDHGEIGHGRTFYQETIRVPLVIFGPGIEPRRVYQNVSLLDIFPTIIDLIGERIPNDVLGRSLRPLIEGKFLPDEPVISEANWRGDKSRAIIWGNYKLVHNYFTNKEELYNLRTDPQEKTNLIDLQPGIASQLRSRLFAVVEQSEKNRQEIFQKPELPGPPLGDVVGY